MTKKEQSYKRTISGLISTLLGYFLCVLANLGYYLLRRRLNFLKAKDFEWLSILNLSVIIYRKTQKVKEIK